MNCKEFQEQITPAVDRYLKKEEMEFFVEHASKCLACRHEYEMELTTKTVVHARVKMVPTPQVLNDAITRMLSEGDLSRSVRNRRTWRDFLRAPYVRPAIVVGFACLAVAVFLTRSTNPPGSLTTASLAGNDVILQSLSNYHAFVNGDITPQLVSNQPEHLKSFFYGKTEFPVLVPSMKECTLVGGVLNEYSGVRLAHVVYRHGKEIVYMYQACWETVTKGEQLSLSASAKDELQRTGWFTETRPDGESIVVWTKGRTMCAAVAHMSKEDLLACLASEPRSGEGESEKKPW